MKTSLFAAAITALAAPVVFAQERDPTSEIYTDPSSNITFNTWSPTPFVTIGVALPPDALEADADEFVGLITCSDPAGWCGVSLGGGMVSNLLVLAYPSPSNPDEILTSLRWASDYGPPIEPYNGDAKLAQISSTLNATHYQVSFRCEKCLGEWRHGEEQQGGSFPSSGGFLLFGWCHASSAPFGEAECADKAEMSQHDSQGLFGATVTSFTLASSAEEYALWAGKATGGAVDGECVV